MKKKYLPKSIAKSARIFLHIFLPLILVEGMFLLVWMALASKNEFLRNFDTFVYSLEHIFMSLLLCVGGFVLLDLADREKQKENN